AYRADARRSIPLGTLAPAIARARALGVDVFSLQKGHGSEQLATLAADAPVVDLGPALDEGGPDAAFVDTAAVIANLDLVVSSDTALPHLAGALGAPTWLLLSHVPDWRWGRRGEATPWYPSLRLFRQSRAGDWSGVVADVAAALETLPVTERTSG
ncbi:MAG TPA: glycosyltransferase family 9 protein, partial [Polyangia bacterium]|nr:glycosyltransferase family 9 protein [Polyangia bacterium]